MKHKITNSIGVYDIYKMLRKHKWLNIGKPMSEHDFYAIIRNVNNSISDKLSCGHKVTLPYQMGVLELVKTKPRIEIKDNKIVTNLPVNWKETLKLWREDEESKKNKVLIRHECKFIYRLHYSKLLCKYINKIFYKFQFNRFLKKDLGKEINNNNKIDAILINYDK